METQVEELLAIHQFTVWPVGYSKKSGQGQKVWMKARYKDNKGRTFLATGVNLPTTAETKFILKGNWQNTQKYGLSFNVTSYDVIMPTSEAGIISFLSSLSVGIGNATAKAIYAAFGENVWDIIDQNPEQLLQVKRISPEILNKLVTKLSDTKVERDVAKLFAGSIEVTATKLRKIKDKYGIKAAEKIKENPYALCEMRGFSFPTVDKLSKNLGFGYDNPNRLAAATMHIINITAMSGHTCYPKEEFANLMHKQLNADYESEVISLEKVKAALNKAFEDGLIKVSSKMLYSKTHYEEEKSVAEEVARLLSKNNPVVGVDALIKDYEKKQNIKLAENQKIAIQNAFKNKVSIITGGAGTGKTTVLKALLYVHSKVYGQTSTPVLMAPTGKAARRITEATNYAAGTIHSVIGLRMEDDNIYCSSEKLEGNIFIVDEVSMLDLSIASLLLKKIPDNANIVFVGDPGQLPSVGCGNVLYDFISSKKVPTTKLEVVYRQAKENPIVANATKIRNGYTDLVYAPSFVKRVYNNSKATFDEACKIYAKCAKKYGLDNVAMLCPFRDKSDLNVSMFNQALQNLINPAKVDEPVLQIAGKVYRQGDRVMQMKNTNEAKNGDVGYIKRIEEIEAGGKKEKQVIIEFNDNGQELLYKEDDMTNIDLAYCTTIHKSQGSQYKLVLIVLSKQHANMLRRNLIYTAVTRATTYCALLVDDENIIAKGIKNDKQDVRYSLLAGRLHQTIK